MYHARWDDIWATTASVLHHVRGRWDTHTHTHTKTSHLSTWRTRNVQANLPRTSEFLKLQISHDADAAKTCWITGWNAGEHENRIVRWWPFVVHHCKQFCSSNANCSQQMPFISYNRHLLFLPATYCRHVNYSHNISYNFNHITVACLTTHHLLHCRKERTAKLPYVTMTANWPTAYLRSY